MISYADEDDEDDIIELCEEVYLASARCDQRLWEVEYEVSLQFFGFSKLFRCVLNCSAT